LYRFVNDKEASQCQQLKQIFRQTEN
jgi:hypothetical protein